MDPLFFELHSGLAHEGPGSTEDTLRALALTGLRGPLRVLDVGSGPGAASLVLLDALPWAEVTAVDLHAPYLEVVTRRAAAGHAERFRTLCADMAALPFPPRSFDLIWSEGAAYSVGVPVALAHWKELLAPGGRIAFSELVWTTATPHPEVRAVFAEEYPPMTDAAGVRGWITGAGLRVVGEFDVSQAAWAAYYDPLERKVAALAEVHGADHPVLVAHRAEIAAWRAHGADFAYRFFVTGR